jgi:predicted phosphoserine aminotransferase
MSHDILYIPGPTEVRPEILAEMAKPLIGHRSGACKELVLRIAKKLAPVFGTERPALFETCPATALMEAAIRNLVKKRVLVLACGAFSERWHQIALSCGKESDALGVEWGQANRPEDLARALATKKYDAVTITHNETSTGAMNDLAALAAIARQHEDVMILVDAVSSLGGAAVDFDTHGLDLVFAGTQKCLAVPPGITVYQLSPRALERAGQVKDRGWLLDFVRAAKGFATGETTATPSVSHLFALDAQLDAILKEGLPSRYERHAAMARRTQAFAKEIGLEMFPEPRALSPTVSTIKGGRVDVEKMLAAVRKKGFVVSNGYGKLKNQTFRIGHMGDHAMPSLEKVLGAIRDAVSAA